MESAKSILLVQLYSELQPANAEPFAIEVLASAIEKECPDCTVAMMLVNPGVEGQSVRDFMAALESSYCDILGFSIPQGTLSLALEILSQLEQLYTHTTRPIVVLGHALPTYAPNQFLERYPWAVAVHSWGEDALIALAKGHTALADIPDIYYVQSGRVVSTPIRWVFAPEPPKRIDPSAFFARVETSRGCVYDRCTFCLRPVRGSRARGTPKWQRLQVDQVLSSVRALKDEGVNSFTFTDEDFLGSDLEVTLELAQGILDIGGMSFSFSGLADDLYRAEVSLEENAKRREIFKTLKASGLSLMFCGVESLSLSQLKRYGKRATVEEIVKGVGIARDLGITLELGFILFDPLLSLQELKENIQMLESTGLWEDIAFLLSAMRVHKDTPYEDMLRRKGLLGEFETDLLTYEWQFADERVARVARECFRWKNEFHPVYLALRNVERTDLSSNYAHWYLVAFRRQDLHLLKQLVKSIESPERFPTVVRPLYRHRLSLAKRLQRVLQRERNTTPNKLLSQRLDEYLSQQDEMEIC